MWSVITLSNRKLMKINRLTFVLLQSMPWHSPHDETHAKPYFLQVQDFVPQGFFVVVLHLHRMTLVRHSGANGWSVFIGTRRSLFIVFHPHSPTSNSTIFEEWPAHNLIVCPQTMEICCSVSWRQVCWVYHAFTCHFYVLAVSKEIIRFDQFKQRVINAILWAFGNISWIEQKLICY